MRLRWIAAAAVLALAGLMLGASRSAASESDAAKLGCKLSGIRYFGSGAGKAQVCFTLTANGKTMRENDLEACATGDVVTSIVRSAKRVAVKANGTFSTSRRALAGDPADLTTFEWMNVTFSGRIQGRRASGTLVLQGSNSGQTFRCTWSARRTSS